MFRFFCLAAMTFVLTSSLTAQSNSPEASKKKPGLSIGSKAPALELSNWLKGKPITKFEKGNVYVLDFWATWCGPCIRAMPHMTEVQKKYEKKGVRILGVSVWESSPSGVKSFVEKKGDGMGYSVAQDAAPAFPDGVEEGSREAQQWTVANGAMSKTWMKASGRNGIPTVFIVDGKGNIAWIGNPMGGMDSALESIVAGDWTYERARVEQDFQRLMSGRKHLEALALFKKNEKFWAKDSQTLNMVAWTIVDPAGPIKEKDLALAERSALRANELTGGKDPAILDTVARVHFTKGEIEKAIEVQKKAVNYASGPLKEQLEAALAEYNKAAGKG
jgi:thiol-disulfide isomerase/thioredoxin